MNNSIKKFLNILSSLLMKKDHSSITKEPVDIKRINESLKKETIESEVLVSLESDKKETEKEGHKANIYPISRHILEQNNDEIISEITSEITPFSAISGPEYYQFVLDYLATDGYFNELGNAQMLKWDFEFLSKVGKIINRLYGKRIINITKDSSVILATLVAEAAIYALINEKNQVGPVEILNSIKNWTQYLSLTDKINIFDTVCRETDCTYHPYHKKEDKKRGKILIFEPKDKRL